MPILSLILWLPLIFAVLVAVVPSGQVQIIRGLTLTAISSVLLLMLPLLGQFDTTTPQLQFSEQMQWNPELGSY